MGNEVSNSSFQLDTNVCFNFLERCCNKTLYFTFKLTFFFFIYKKRREKKGVVFITSLKSTRVFIWGTLDGNLLGIALKLTMQRTRSEWETSWTLPKSVLVIMASVETGAHAGKWWGDHSREWFSRTRWYLFKSSFIYLDQLTYEIAGILTRTCDTSFPWRLRSSKHTIFTLKRAWKGRGRFAGGQALNRVQFP